jgi:predicted hydrocarbon binding protein
LTPGAGIERAIKLRKEELIATKKLYETVMTFAAHGLFYRSGRLIGERIAKTIGTDVNSLKQYLIDEGWVLDIEFEGDTVIAKGSIEASESDVPTCHMLRGLLSKFFEEKIGRDVYCHERSCQSKGDEYCVFTLDAEMIK